MALVLHTNISSLTAQRNLRQSGNDTTRALGRLSSGLRINTAGDDAAGLAISNRMTSQVRGLNQAGRNTNDGISLTQTADGALSGMINLLQRIRELAVQSANVTNTDSDRESLQNEVAQLIEQYDHISNQTEFNGNRLLTGSFSGNLQVGSEVNQIIDLSIPDIRGDKVGGRTNFKDLDDTPIDSLVVHIAGSDNFAGGLINATLAGVPVPNVTWSAAHNNSVAKIEAINQISAETGVTAFSFGNGAVGDINVTEPTAMAGGGLIISAELTADSRFELVDKMIQTTKTYGVY